MRELEKPVSRVFRRLRFQRFVTTLVWALAIAFLLVAVILGSLKALGQLRESFILATNEDGLWIIDQHVAHERVLFEKVLRERKTEGVQRQRLLMPLLVELTPDQMVVFAEIASELERNGFEAESSGYLPKYTQRNACFI